MKENKSKAVRCFSCQECGHMLPKEKEDVPGVVVNMCVEGVETESNQNAALVEVDTSVSYWGCEGMKHEAEVQKIRLKEKVSQAEAVKMPGQEK